MITSTLGRLALLGVAVATAAAGWGAADPHVLWLLGGLALVMFVPRLALPRPLAQPVIMIAMASFYIYLVHNFMIWTMRTIFGISAPVPVLLAAIAAGVLTWWITTSAKFSK